MMLRFEDHIEAHLGFGPGSVFPGRIVRFPTSQRASDRAGWCLLFRDEKAGVYGDWRTKEGGCWFAEDQRPRGHHERDQRRHLVEKAWAEERADRAARWRKAAINNRRIWEASKPVRAGDPVCRYLSLRALGNASLCDIRCHPDLDYWADGAGRIGSFPAMVAAVRNPSGEIVSLHRTYLTEGGRKAPVDVVKKLAPASSCLDGACVRLGSPVRIEGQLWLGVAEGIETALAASVLFGIPTVSALSAGGLEKFAWPEGLQSMAIFADNDQSGVGETSARSLAARATRAGVVTRISLPSAVGTDWADMCLANSGDAV